MSRWWPVVVPFLALAVLAAAFGLGVGPVLTVLCVATLVPAVLAAVHHAELIAHRVGEPYGTLILALAVTVIEGALIVSMMLAGGPGAATLARDTIFSAVMIIAAGVVGICLLIGALKHREQDFRVEGANAALATLMAMAALTLVLPTFTTSSPGRTYTPFQLAVASFCALALWLVFVFVQTIRHRDYFLPAVHPEDEHEHAAPPTRSAAWASLGLLLASLVGIVGLAKKLSPAIERIVESAGAPQAVIGVAIALLVLLAEALAAVRAARANRLQTSLNLALGSALASIGLTIPAVALAAVWFDLPLELGLEAKDLVLLTLTFLVSSVTFVNGRTHILQGAVHLVIFATFLTLALAP